MRRTLEILGRHKLLALIFFIVLLLFVLKGLSKKPEYRPDSTAGPSAPSFRSLTPGVSTKKQVADQLGAVIEEVKLGEGTLASYLSNNPNFPHQVAFEDEKAIFIKEIVTMKDNKRANDIQQQFGPPTDRLYNSASSNSNFFLFVNPQSGFAYIGHPDGTLLEVWYFQPTSLEDFREKWAPSYSLQPPTTQLQ